MSMIWGFRRYSVPPRDFLVGDGNGYECYKGVE
jgi:hypothetical protein